MIDFEKTITGILKMGYALRLPELGPRKPRIRIYHRDRLWRVTEGDTLVKALLTAWIVVTENEDDR